MNSFQAWRIVLSADQHAVGITPNSGSVGRIRQGQDGLVCNGSTLNQADPLELGQQGQSLDGLVRQIRAAAQINVADAVTVVNQPLDAFVGNLPAVAQVDIMQVLAELGDGGDGNICDISALGQHKVAQARCDFDDLLNGGIG